ncbi:MAG TPA: oxidoreductase [Lentisphaeria bacterium]|nr:MAG: oxidoreductase [Lentisphaerae bacterium GWF2_50_93]HCE43189.1 oxidoreductase [Lentisphaeria bacterium]
MNDLKGKVVIVTGGAQGIGKGITRHFLGLGMRVVMAEMDEEAGLETLDEYKDLGELKFVRTDISIEAEGKNAVERTIEYFGSLYALINNAGIPYPGTVPPEELSLESWNRVIGVNLTGSFIMAKHSIPHLKKTRGSIVNISSTRGLMSEPCNEAYSSSKGGIIALTHALANSLSGKVRANCISPGWIIAEGWHKRKHRKKTELTQADLDQHPAGRIGKPEDIAEMAAFLISEKAGFITGQNFVVDGGMTKKMIYI